MVAAVTLTAREAAVLRLLACGSTYVQIADRLGVSLNTAATHVKNIYRKLEVRSARAAVWRAFELRLLARPQAQDAPAGAESAATTLATPSSSASATSTVTASSGGSSAAN
jgi:DNA-binding CsgD family transcriptional regulator